jgi:hypothetical protein
MLVLLCHKVKIAHKHRTIWAALETSGDLPGEQISKRGDGIGYLTLCPAGHRAACNPRVGQTLLVEQSFFSATAFESVGDQKAVSGDTERRVVMKAAPTWGERGVQSPRSSATRFQVPFLNRKRAGVEFPSLSEAAAADRNKLTTRLPERIVLLRRLECQISGQGKQTVESAS